MFPGGHPGSGWTALSLSAFPHRDRPRVVRQRRRSERRRAHGHSVGAGGRLQTVRKWLWMRGPAHILVESLQHYVMTYTAFSRRGPRIAIAISDDLLHWRRIGLASSTPSSIQLTYDQHRPYCRSTIPGLAMGAEPWQRRVAGAASLHASRTIEVLMKYVPNWIPTILILGLVAVRLFRPLPVGDAAGAPRARSYPRHHRTVGSTRTAAPSLGGSFTLPSNPWVTPVSARRRVPSFA
jgi:hypothetical protein